MPNFPNPPKELRDQLRIPVFFVTQQYSPENEKAIRAINHEDAAKKYASIIGVNGTIEIIVRGADCSRIFLVKSLVEYVVEEKGGKNG